MEGQGNCIYYPYSQTQSRWCLPLHAGHHVSQGAIERGWFKTERSRTRGKPALGPILATALELAEAMQYLHSRDIVHGDLTPANVLLSDKDSAPHGFTVKAFPPSVCSIAAVGEIEWAWRSGAVHA